ncbi:MAG: hypothetical protein J6Y82_06660 [Bacteroidales bacterium]|nr:hypothetical protein [Bacteroidales bacterium]
MKKLYSIFALLIAANVTALADAPDFEYVDLGLPSGTLWAKWNVGATAPQGFGDYFAWGEVEPYYSSLDPLAWKEGKEDGYAWSSYKYIDANVFSNSEILEKGLCVTKYTFADGQTSGVWYDSEGNFIGDNKTLLEPADDAATVNWGAGWIMPSNEQWQELIDECYSVWTDDYNGTGVAGIIVYATDVEADKGVYVKSGETPKESYIIGPDNHIFLPASGYYDGAVLNDGFYGWSASASTDEYSYYCLYPCLDNGVFGNSRGGRFFGDPVRAVRAKSYTVQIQQPAENGGIILEDDDISLAEGVLERTILHFKADPNDDYELDEWTGCKADGTLVVTGNATVTCSFKPKTTTAVKNEKADALKVQKVIENGTMYIIRDGEKYSLQGVKCNE